MKAWTDEERAAHGRKIREAIQLKQGRPNGSIVVLSRPRIAKSSRLGTELERAMEAMALVERIGWELARELAARMK